MSNKIYEGGFYNEYQKKRYVNTVPDKSKEQIERILSRARSIEEEFDCDLYNFSLNQIERFFHYLEPTTLNSSRSNFYIVSNYIRWAISQDLRDNNLNPLELLNDSDYLKQFINKSKNKLYTKEEIDEICRVCENAQRSPVYLLFEGALGSAGYNELLNLREKHLKDNNYIELWEGSKSRSIQVSEECMRTLKQAVRDKTYKKKNGMISERARNPAEADLVDNDFVLKNVNTRNKDNGRANKFLVNRRIAAVKDYNDLDVLTPYIIRNSGMLYMAYKLYQEFGKLEKPQYDMICEQFGMTKVNNGGYELYNVQRQKDDFLNIPTLKRIYHIE